MSMTATGGPWSRGPLASGLALRLIGIFGRTGNNGETGGGRHGGPLPVGFTPVPNDVATAARYPWGTCRGPTDWDWS